MLSEETTRNQCRLINKFQKCEMWHWNAVSIPYVHNHIAALLTEDGDIFYYVNIALICLNKDDIQFVAKKFLFVGLSICSTFMCQFKRLSTTCASI